jgi:hypothetical protein
MEVLLALVAAGATAVLPLPLIFILPAAAVQEELHLVSQLQRQLTMLQV